MRSSQITESCFAMYLSKAAGIWNIKYSKLLHEEALNQELFAESILQIIMNAGYFWENWSVPKNIKRKMQNSSNYSDKVYIIFRVQKKWALLLFPK